MWIFGIHNNLELCIKVNIKQYREIVVEQANNFFFLKYNHNKHTRYI